MRDVKMLIAVLSDLPAALLQRSHLGPEVADELRELQQLRIAIVRDHAKQRLDAELIEHTSQPLKPRPVHVRSDVVQTNEIPSRHGCDAIPRTSSNDTLIFHAVGFDAAAGNKNASHGMPHLRSSVIP